MHADAELIDKLGGPAELARKLGYQEEGAIQRVQNWKTRGIPPRVRLENPVLFGLLIPRKPKPEIAKAA